MFKEFPKSIWFNLAVIIVLTIPLCLGFFNSHLINAHDSMAGLIRALSMDKYMGHGQFLVRWAPGINWGYGYPMFNFYPPFFSFISVLIFKLTHNMVLSINLACTLFWMLSGLGMFLLSREFWGTEGGMLSAVLYVYAPYHIADLYVRGAFAEFSSFAFFPFLLFSILKMSRKMSLGAFLLGVGSIFGLSLTHNIMSMVFFPIAIAFVFYLYFTENRSSWIFPVLGMFVIGLMMSSFFWLPALIEKKFLNLGFLISMRYDFHKNFVSAGQLFWPFNKNVVDDLSFQIGVVHTLLCLGTLACIGKIFKVNRRLGSGYIFFLGITLAAIFLTLPYSHMFWERIKMLSFIQFPWRILAIIVFTMSFLGGSIVLLIKDPTIRNIVIIAIGLSTILIYLNSVSKPTFVNEQKIEDFLAMGEGEYTPRWIMIPPNNAPAQKFEIVYGAGQLGQEKVVTPVESEIEFQTSETSLLCFHSFYFPGWHVYIDGRSTKPYLNNPFGVILFSVPPGDHHIRVVLGSTLIRIAAMIVSWLGFIVLLGVIILRTKLIK